ncbi:MAG: hypothetical protein GY765_02665 [bacterium]|nr:hypothetical protein [bacterium]
MRLKGKHVAAALIVLVAGIFVWKFLFKDFSRLMPRYLKEYKEYGDRLIKEGTLYYQAGARRIAYQDEKRLETDFAPFRNNPRGFLDKYTDKKHVNYYYYRISMLYKDVGRFNKAGSTSGRARYFRFKEKVKLVKTSRGKRYLRQLTLAGVNPYSHKRASPTLESRRWEGKLYFREARQGISLVAGKTMLTVLRSNEGWTSPDSGFQHDLASGKSRRYNPGTLKWGGRRKGGCYGKMLELVYIDHGQRKAQVVYNKEHAVIKQKGNDPYFRIYINQASEGKAAHLKAELEYPLQVGDIVTFERIHVRTGDVIFSKDFFVSERTDPSLISFYKHIPDYRQEVLTRRRQYNVTDFSYAEDVCTGLDMVMGRLMSGEEDHRNTFDVYLTIDKDLQATVTRLLHRFIAAHWRGKKVRAGITVMDAVDGDVLAMASHPGEGGGRKRKATLKSAGGGYGINQNLRTHGIGSIAKLLVAAAIFNRAPELAGIEVPCRVFPKNLTSQRILGVDFVANERINLPPRGPCAGGGNARLNINDLLKFSPNQYIVELGLLSLAVCTPGQINILKTDADASSEFKRLKKVKVGKDTHLLLHRSPGERLKPQEYLYNVGGLSTLEHMPYFKYYVRLGDRITYYLKDYWVVEEFQKLFNLTAILDARSEEQLYETGVYNSFLDALYEEFNVDGNTPGCSRRELAPLLNAVSPETAVMSINTYTNLRREFISFLLGGATNRWTNTKLCEAMSRLVTGKEIKTNLFHRVRFYDEDGRTREVVLNNTPVAEGGMEEKKLPIDQRAHETLLTAMQKTIETRGTAYEPITVREKGKRKRITLKSKLEFYNNGSDVYRLYSKTGTFSRKIRRKKLESANYLFTVALTDEGKFVDGVTVAIFIKDVGSSKNAVRLATLLMDTLFDYKNWRKL